MCEPNRAQWGRPSENNGVDPQAPLSPGVFVFQSTDKDLARSISMSDELENYPVDNKFIDEVSDKLRTMCAEMGIADFIFISYQAHVDEDGRPKVRVQASTSFENAEMVQFGVAEFAKVYVSPEFEKTERKTLTH